MNWIFAQSVTETAGSASNLRGLMCFTLFLVLLFTLIALIVGQLIRRSASRKSAQSPEARKIAQIAHDFPDEVRAWGGPTALANSKTVRAIIARIESQDAG